MKKLLNLLFGNKRRPQINSNTIIGKDVSLGRQNYIIDSNIGDKCIIESNCFISSSKIADKTKIYDCVKMINSSIDKYTYIAEGSKMTNTKIGKFTSIGPNVIIGYGKHPLNYISTSPVFYSNNKQLGFSFTEDSFFDEYEEIIIGNDVLISANVYIKDGVSISDGAVVGAGAVVTKDVPPYAIVGGVPAIILKYRFDNETINKLLDKKWWNYTEKELRMNLKYFQSSNFELFKNRN